MSLTQLAPPYPIFTDKDGSPLDNGYLYFGELNLNPETNPIQVYWDNMLTQPAAQPIRTINGYPSRNGAPALIYAADRFSVTVRNKQNELVTYSPAGFGVIPFAPVTFATSDFAVKDVATLLADVDYTYAAGVPGTIQVSAGDILSTLAESFAYEVAASGATDQHVTTAGGVKLYVQASSNGFNVRAFGAVGDGITDDTAAIQEAIDVASAVANSEFPVVVSLSDGNYGISSALNMNDADFVSLEAGGLVAIGSGWSATDPILTMTTPVSDDLKSCGLRHVYIDCKHLCAGVLLKNTFQGFLDRVHVTHAKTYHIKAEQKNGDLHISSCIVNQWFWGESGFDTIANRTAYGFWIDCADVIMVSCTGFYCLEPLRGTGGNTQVSACHFYNGATVDGTDNMAIHLYGARGYVIADCYIDNGIVKITGGSTTGVSGTGGDEFNHTITGIAPGPGAAGNITTSVELVAVDANEAAEGLRVDLLLRGLAAGLGLRQSTSGSGSWTNLKARISFIDRDGAASAYGKTIVPDGTAAAPGLVFSSEADTNTGLYRTAADQIGFACNGAGVAFVSPNGLEAGSAGVGVIGSSTNQFAATFSTILRIVDGTGAPSVIAGYAAIYVDAADGDLKIRFSDGTVKTIVTDT